MIAVGAGAAAAGVADGSSGRSTQNATDKLALTIVYTGSGSGMIVQHNDNRPGHAGPAFDDTLTKKASWKISWPVTIEGGNIRVGDPTGEVFGTARAVVRSEPGLSCAGYLRKPGAIVGKPYIPTLFQVIKTTPTSFTIRLEGLPLNWADADSKDLVSVDVIGSTANSSCFAALGAISVAHTNSPAVLAWFKGVDPVFTLSKADNYLKVRPNTFGKKWEFPPVADQKQVALAWSSRITIAGQGTPGPTTSAKPKPPTKKPCTPASGKPAPLTQSAASGYLRKLASWIEKYGNDLQERIPNLPQDAINYASEKLIYKCGLRAGPSLFGPPPPPPPPPPDVEDDSFQGVDVSSSPDVLSASAGGPGGRYTTAMQFTKAGIAALRSGKPLTITLKGVFRVKGKPPLTATTTITFKGRRSTVTPSITSLTFGGSVQSPSIVVHGVNLGTKPAPNPAGSPANRPLCPGAINGNAGLDYGTSLYLNDTTGNWAAGRYRPAANELDCIGLIVTKFTPTEVDYRFGGFYAQVYPKLALAGGDAVEVGVNGATKTVHVKYGATVTS